MRAFADQTQFNESDGSCIASQLFIHTPSCSESLELGETDRQLPPRGKFIASVRGGDGNTRLRPNIKEAGSYKFSSDESDSIVSSSDECSKD
jgi:hypothetical protein